MLPFINFDMLYVFATVKLNFQDTDWIIWYAWYSSSLTTHLRWSVMLSILHALSWHSLWLEEPCASRSAINSIWTLSSFTANWCKILIVIVTKWKRLILVYSTSYHCSVGVVLWISISLCLWSLLVHFLSPRILCALSLIRWSICWDNIGWGDLGKRFITWNSQLLIPLSASSPIIVLILLLVVSSCSWCLLRIWSLSATSRECFLIFDSATISIV